MTEKHTPAPWEICENAPNDHWYPGVTIGSANPDDARRICDLSFFADYETRKANGNLICAAPDMLEILKELLMKLEEVNLLYDERIKIAAVLAKAIGDV